MIVRLQYVSGCGKSTIKVQRKYAESKAYVQLKYGKSTVKYGKSTVLYGIFFWAPTVAAHDNDCWNNLQSGRTSHVLFKHSNGEQLCPQKKF